MVGPPSRHASGQIYAWHPECTPEAPIPPAPGFLIDLVARKRAVARLAMAETLKTNAPRSAVADVWSPNGLYELVATATEGERNSRLFWCASRLGDDVRKGRVADARADDVLDQLSAIAERRGLDRREVERTIRSALHGVGA